MVLLRLGCISEVVTCMSRVLDLYQGRSVDYRKDAFLVQCLVDCKYASATKSQSSNWSKVKFKENCIVVDPLGAGDYKCISNCFPLTSRKVNSLTVAFFCVCA